MPIRKNKSGIWQIDFATANGERVRCSSKTTDKKLAQHLHDKLKLEAWQVDKLNKKPERTVEQALIRFLEEGEHQKNLDTKIRHAQYWRNAIGQRSLSSLTTDDIVAHLPTHKLSTGEKLSPATQNRYRSSILRALSLAKQSGWIDSVPYIPKSKEPKIRVRWISKSDAMRFLDNLHLDWMRDLCSFALATGARMNEILTLTWDKIDLEQNIAVISGDLAKSGKPRPLLLGDDGLAVIQKRQQLHISDYVFHRGTGRQIRHIDRRDFAQALEKTGIDDFRFHDLRHTWASWHAQSGTPLMILKELGGWENLEMVKKYAHLNADHLREFANNVKFTSNSLQANLKREAENEAFSENKKAVSC